MREIEFRGKTDGDWCYGSLINSPTADQYYIAEHLGDELVYPVEEETIGQYTGIEDKSGTRIYEGDIIYFKDENMYGLINFRYGGWYITWYGYVQVCNGVSWEEKYTECNEESLCSNCLTEEDKIPYEIVGNIHDNPELLGGDNG